jgi:hypothetical protein
MRCDLCGRTDDTVVEVANPPHLTNLRRSAQRRHHETCLSALLAHREAEEARTRSELDRRIQALYEPAR